MLKNARWARDTTVGVKVGMALSGALLSGWVLLHMLGNLLVFAGPDVINPYGAALQGSPLVWVMRLVIGAALAVHVAGAVVLTRRAREARQTRYRYGLKAQLSTLSLAEFVAARPPVVHGCVKAPRQPTSMERRPLPCEA